MRIKNTAKRLLAALLCALMVLSVFAVIPAMAEETTAATDETTEPSENGSTGGTASIESQYSHLTGFDYLMAVSAAGGKVSFDDWVIPDALQNRIDDINKSSSSDATKASNIRKAYAPYVQKYLLSKTGIFLTNSTGPDLTSSFVTNVSTTDVPDYRINLTSSGQYANNALYSASDMNLDGIIDKKLDGNAAFLGLLNGEVGPTKFSITMDFTFSSNFTGTAEGNNEDLHAYTEHRGFSVIDFGGGWALKATAPGAGQITVETDENGDPVKYNVDHIQTADGKYYKVTSVGAGTANVGYLYSDKYNEQMGYAAYVFDADTKMGWSNNSTLLRTLRDDVADDPETEEDETVKYNEKYLITDPTDPHYTYVEVEGEDGTKVKVPSSYYVKSIGAASVPYYLIDGDETNGETFSYTVGKPVTLRFDFEKTWVSGDNNDTVIVKLYGVKDNGDGTTTDVYIGHKSYTTTTSVKNYGFRMSDNATAGLMFDNLSIVIAEDSETLPCNGDHSSYWSKCEPKVQNLPNALTVKYACGVTEYVDHIVENGITSVLAGKSLTLTGDTLTSTSTGKTLGFVTYTGTIKTGASYAHPSEEHNFIRLCGRDILRITPEGKLVTYSNDSASPTSDTTPQELGVTLAASKSYSLKIVTRPVSGYKYDIDFYIDGELKGTETIDAVYTSSLLRITKLMSGDTSLVYIDSSSAPRLTVDNDFYVVAEINTAKDYTKPAADSPIISLGGKSLLTLNKDGKLVLAGGEVAMASLKPMSTYAVAVKMIPTFSGFSYIVYIEDEEAGRSQIAFETATGFTFSAPAKTELNNIKVAHFNTTFPTTDIGIKSVVNADAPVCPHMSADMISNKVGSDRKFYTAPLILNHSSGTTMGVNSLWYSYDCYYCGERIFVSAGSNLYNGTETYPLRSYNADNTENTNVTPNSFFDGDGVLSAYAKTATYLHTNKEITKSGGKNFWLNLTFTLDPTEDGNLDISWGGVADSNGYGFFSIYSSGSTSMMRLWAIAPEDTDNNPVTDTTPLSKVTVVKSTSDDYSKKYFLIGYGSSAQTSKYTLMRAGKSIDLTFYMDMQSGKSTSKVWCNGELVATNMKQFGSANTANGYSFRVFENTFGDVKLSNFAFVLDEPTEAETHVHTEDYTVGKRVSFTDYTLSYIYQCYCGAYVEESISSVIKNNISNFYNGYGKVEELDIPADGRFWVSTDINIKKDGLSGPLVKIGDSVALEFSQLKNVTAPTSVNVSVMMVDETFGKVYIDGTYSHNVNLKGSIDSVTFGEENTYDSYVTFKHNKIVTLAQNAQNAPTITFDDNPEGAICYHQNNTNTSYRSGGNYIFTDITDGYTFGDSDRVKGMKNIKARYICSECGEAVYAVQGEAMDVNPTLSEEFTSRFEMLAPDENGNAQAASMKFLPIDLNDMGRGNSYWLSFDVSASNFTPSDFYSKSSGFGFLDIAVDNGNLSKAGTDLTYKRFLRGYALLRPDAKPDVNGKYGQGDYYDDRIGVFYDAKSEMINQPESAYSFIMVAGSTYHIDICFERVNQNRSDFTIYLNGKAIYHGNMSEEPLAPERLNTTGDLLAGLQARPASFRFFDGSYGTFNISNLSAVKMGGGNDDYSENTSVFEMSVTNPAKAEKLASINGVELLSATADGQLTVGGTALYKRADGVYTPITLTSTASKLAIVYYNGTARYYIDEDLAFLGETDTVTATIAVGDTDLSATNLTVGSTVTVSDIYGVAGDGDADYITFQEGVDTTFNSEIRVLSGVDMLYYNRVGYRVVTDNNGTVTSSTEKSLSVYSSVLENVGSTTNTVDAARYGHRYYSILKLTDLANNDAANEYYLYVTPFTMVDDEIVYSAKTAKITVTKGSENSYVHTTVSTDTVPEVTETVVE